MAWTAPRTWVTGEIVTAAQLNGHVRDNLSYLKGATGAVELDNAEMQAKWFQTFSLASGNWAYVTRVSGDADPRWYITNNGVQYWGSGSAAADVNLYRDSSDKLRTDDDFSVNNRTVITRAGAGGDIIFGGDTNLYRAAADTLKTDDYFAHAGFGTSFPGSPVDGQLFTLVDSTTAPTWVWHFRYTTAPTQDQWVCIGGAPHVVYVSAEEATTSTSWANLTTAGPSWTTPYQGTWLFTASVGSAHLSAGGNDLYMGISVNGDADPTRSVKLAVTLADDLQAPLHVVLREASLPASRAIKMRYKVSGSTGTYNLGRTLTAMPIALW